MKALRNFVYGYPAQTFVAGTILPQDLFNHPDLDAVTTGGAAVVGSEVHDELVKSGVITDNDSAPMPLLVDVQYLNYLVQEGDSARERLAKMQESANRASGVQVPVAPMAAPSQVEAGTKADADAAIAKANAAKAAAPAQPTEPAAPAAPAANPGATS